jgi:hypothetical protein
VVIFLIKDSIIVIGVIHEHVDFQLAINNINSIQLKNVVAALNLTQCATNRNAQAIGQDLSVKPATVITMNSVPLMTVGNFEVMCALDAVSCRAPEMISFSV